MPSKNIKTITTIMPSKNIETIINQAKNKPSKRQTEQVTNQKH